MKYETDIKTTTDALPTFRTKLSSEELNRMIAAILHGTARPSENEICDLLITDEGDKIKLSSDNSVTFIFERPIVPSEFLQTAISLLKRRKMIPFTADPETRTAVCGDVSVKLTDTEFRLYLAILENGNNFISHEKLSMKVWGKNDRNLCTVYVSYLRQKLDSAFGDGTIVTARRKGYRLRNTDL